MNDWSTDAPASGAVPLPQDDKLVKVYIKIRDTMAAVTQEYETRMKLLKEQQDVVRVEVIRRLQERGATQTKTPFGTAFLGESLKSTIADKKVFGDFCLAQRDVDFFQARVKVEHLKEWMDAHEGALPPGLSIFREVTLNVRAK